VIAQPIASIDGIADPGQRHWAIASVLAGMVLVVLDAAIANIALPTIATSLQVTPASAVQVVSGYQLGLVVMLLPAAALASADTVVIPIGRETFHKRIWDEQRLLDRADGKQDKKVTVSGNEDINLAVTDYMMNKVRMLEDSIELNNKIPGQLEKVKYLSYLNTLVRSYRTGWKSKQLDPAFAQVLVQQFEQIMNFTIDGRDMAPLINDIPYEAAKILSGNFQDNPGCEKHRKVPFTKITRP